MAPKQTDPQFKLRMTPEIKDAIEESAVRHNRSMNAEIVTRLQDSFKYYATEAKLRSLQRDYEKIQDEIDTMEADLREVSEARSAAEENYKNQSINIKNFKIILKSICHLTLSYGDSAPKELRNLARETLQTLMEAGLSSTDGTPARQAGETEKG